MKFQKLTPNLVVRDVAAAVEFYAPCSASSSVCRFLIILHTFLPRLRTGLLKFSSTI